MLMSRGTVSQARRAGRANEDPFEDRYLAGGSTEGVKKLAGRCPCMVGTMRHYENFRFDGSGTVSLYVEHFDRE